METKVLTATRQQQQQQQQLAPTALVINENVPKRELFLCVAKTIYITLAFGKMKCNGSYIAVKISVFQQQRTTHTPNRYNGPSLPNNLSKNSRTHF